MKKKYHNLHIRGTVSSSRRKKTESQLHRYETNENKFIRITSNWSHTFAVNLIAFPYIHINRIHNRFDLIEKKKTEFTIKDRYIRPQMSVVRFLISKVSHIWT